MVQQRLPISKIWSVPSERTGGGLRIGLCGPGFREPMVKRFNFSIEFERQVSQEYLAGETLHGLAERHLISRNLIRFG